MLKFAMVPSRPSFPLVSLLERIRARVATYRHGWFKALVWFLFGAMTIVLFPGFLAVWFWRLSHRPPPIRGRRVSMLVLAVLAGLFQVLWLNVLIIDPLAGLGEAQDLPLETSAENRGLAADEGATTVEVESATTATPEVEVEIEGGGAVPPTTSQAPVADTTTTGPEGAATTVPQLETTTSTAVPSPGPTTASPVSDASTSAPQTTVSVPPTTTPPANQTAAAGGRLASLAAAAEADGGVAYDRDLYGGWTTVRSGCNTRCAVLEEERRADGTWLSWYDGMIASDASQLDIDHMVPLAEAHTSGAWQWSSSRKRSYANDLVHPQALAAVSASSNRSKGSRDPSEWRPPDGSAWCRYATDWVTVKTAWGLTADRAEIRALQEMLDTCDTGVTLTTIPVPDTTTTTVVTTTAVVSSSGQACPYTSAAGDPCAEMPELGNRSNDVNCGDIPDRFKPLTVVGQDHDRLDGNNDGLACTG